MRLFTISLIGLFLLPLAAGATTTMCTVDSEAPAPKTVVWDTVTKKAKISYLGDTVVGEVTLIAKGGSGRDLFNLSFAKIPPLWKESEWEFVVHEPSPGGFVIFGVGYKVIDGRKYLSSTKGMVDAKCESI